MSVVGALQRLVMGHRSKVGEVGSSEMGLCSHVRSSSKMHGEVCGKPISGHLGRLCRINGYGS